MTDVILRKKLKAALRLYNCTDWDVSITSAVLGVLEDGDVETLKGGQCFTLYRYHKASIEISNAVEEKHLDYIVRHEAAHVLLGEMSDTAKRLLAFVPEELQDAWWDIYMDAEEHTADRLAKSVMHKEPQ